MPCGGRDVEDLVFWMHAEVEIEVVNVTGLWVRLCVGCRHGSFQLWVKDFLLCYTNRFKCLWINCLHYRGICLGV